MVDVPKSFANYCDWAWFIVSFLAERRDEAAAADLHLEARLDVYEEKICAEGGKTRAE
jgi:hypothetical protein